MAEKHPVNKKSGNQRDKKSNRPLASSMNMPNDPDSDHDLQDSFFSSKEEQEKNITLLDAVSDGTWEWNTTSGSVRFSDHWLKFTGYSRAESPETLLSWKQLIHPDDLSAFEEAVDAHLSRATTSIQVEYRLRAKDGHYIWILDRGKTIYQDEDDATPLWAVGTHTDISKQRNALAQVVENEQTIRTLLNASSDNAALISLDGAVCMVNRQMASFFDTDVESMIGNPVERYLQDKPKQLFLAHLEELKRTGRPQRYERKLRGQIGIVMLTPIYNTQGELSSAAVYVRDITDQKLAEEALIHQERLYRSLLENSFDGILVMDEEERIHYASPGAQRTLGYSQNDFLGKNIFDFVAEDYQETFAGTIAYLKANPGKPLREEMIMTCKKSRSCIVEAINLNLLQDADVRGIVINFRDISDRKQSEAALREYSERLEEMVDERTRDLQVSEARFRAVFESSQDAILVWDREYRYLFANQAAIDQVGTTPDKVIGKTIQDGLGHVPEFMQLWISRVDTAFETGKSTHYEDQDILSGKKVYSESSVFPIRDIQGNIFAIGVVYRDITKRKKAELNLKRSRAELEVVNNELKEFAYVVSHDLKAPLRAIGQLAEWVRSDYQTLIAPEGREMLDLIVKRTSRMQALIEGVLTYSKAGREKEEKKPVNLNLMIQVILENIAPPASLTIHIQEDLPTIMAEPTRIEQVFQNLITNAVKFLNKPNGQITISAMEHPQTWEFVVADNGPGIPKKYHDKIFQIFQTLQSRDQYESTGIGLALVKKFVEGWEGKVWVESVVGEGAAFHFTIPKGGIDEER